MSKRHDDVAAGAIDPNLPPGLHHRSVVMMTAVGERGAATDDEV